ncbi:hypothetical protein B0H17DRAFT_1139984 [Mycena rosella]|uniref:Exportin-1 C-terminal domain-containing protein n=1 Tax=Mycena rosella TaxID=1033263 RepID=A0AAD7GBV4_MYCRO|nr:hypothetical protein B0H17DRAFT_1139984 [Mycena rosella]
MVHSFDTGSSSESFIEDLHIDPAAHANTSSLRVHRRAAALEFPADLRDSIYSENMEVLSSAENRQHFWISFISALQDLAGELVSLVDAMGRMYSLEGVAKLVLSLSRCKPAEARWELSTVPSSRRGSVAPSSLSPAQSASRSSRPRNWGAQLPEIFWTPDRIDSAVHRDLKWDSLMARTAQILDVLGSLDNIKMLSNVLKTNVYAWLSTGSFYLPQVARIFIDMLGLYETLRTAALKDILKLETYIKAAEDLETVNANFIPLLLDAMLGDYNRDIPIPLKLTVQVPATPDAVFEPTLDMINRDFTNFRTIGLGYTSYCRCSVCSRRSLSSPHKAHRARYRRSGAQQYAFLGIVPGDRRSGNQSGQFGGNLVGALELSIPQLTCFLVSSAALSRWKLDSAKALVSQVASNGYFARDIRLASKKKSKYSTRTREIPGSPLTASHSTTLLSHSSTPIVPKQGSSSRAPSSRGLGRGASRPVHIKIFVQLNSYSFQRPKPRDEGARGGEPSAKPPNLSAADHYKGHPEAGDVHQGCGGPRDRQRQLHATAPGRDVRRLQVQEVQQLMAVIISRLGRCSVCSRRSLSSPWTVSMKPTVRDIDDLGLSSAFAPRLPASLHKASCTETRASNDAGSRARQVTLDLAGSPPFQLPDPKHAFLGIVPGDRRSGNQSGQFGGNLMGALELSIPQLTCFLVSSAALSRWKLDSAKALVSQVASNGYFARDIRLASKKRRLRMQKSEQSTRTREVRRPAGQLHKIGHVRY